jgi:hypothetical protein
VIEATVQQTVDTLDTLAMATLTVASTGSTTSKESTGTMTLENPDLAMFVQAVMDTSNTSNTSMNELAELLRRELEGLGVDGGTDTLDALVEAMTIGSVFAMALAMFLVGVIADTNQSALIVPQAAKAGLDLSASLRRLTYARDAESRKIALGEVERVAQRALSMFSTVLKPTSLSSAFRVAVPAVQKQIDVALLSIAQVLQLTPKLPSFEVAGFNLTRMRWAWLHMVEAFQISASKSATTSLFSLSPTTTVRV